MHVVGAASKEVPRVGDPSESQGPENSDLIQFTLKSRAALISHNPRALHQCVDHLLILLQKSFGKMQLSHNYIVFVEGNEHILYINAVNE